jgi:hypothetical protein
MTRLHARLGSLPRPRGDAARPALVVRSDREDDLERIGDAEVQAVVFEPPRPPSWLDELAEALESGRFFFERTVLGSVDLPEIDRFLKTRLPASAVSSSVRHALTDDILALVERVAVATGASRFMFRAHTDAPNRRCGFHIDTVPPGAPAVGYLRVYNGAGTDYVEPQNVSSVGDFYRHLSRRERLEHEVRRAGGTARREGLLEQLVQLDDRPEFMLDPKAVCVAPARSIVAFKHLDARLHWSNHPKHLAWIHRSPMHGERRLVVNVSARGPSARRRAR